MSVRDGVKVIGSDSPSKTIEDLSATEFMNGFYKAFTDSRDESGEPNPINALQVVSLFLHWEKIPPKDLREWLIQKIEIYMEGGGDITLDKAFGLSGEGGKNVSAQERFRDQKSEIFKTMHRLIHDCGLENRRAAARIAHTLKSDEKEVPSDETAKYLAEEYAKWAKSKMGLSFNKHLGSIYIPWVEQLITENMNRNDKKLLENILKEINGG